MFLSGPTMGLRSEQSLEKYEDDFSFRLRKKEQHIFNVKNYSLSENNIAKFSAGDRFAKSNNSNGNLTNSVNSLNYDADSDSSELELVAPDEWSWELRCEVCNLQFSSPFEETFKTKSSSPSPKKELTGRKKNFRKKFKAEKHKRFSPVVGGVNLEEYKDVSYKMDKFDPNCERVWRLEYFNQQYSPKLSKIIIGRGHHNEFPELNSVHLINEMRDTKETQWRSDILHDIKFNSRIISEEFNLVPTNHTCQFCFFEKTLKLNELKKSDEPFRRKNSIENGENVEHSKNMQYDCNGTKESSVNGKNHGNVKETQGANVVDYKFDLLSKFRSGILLKKKPTSKTKQEVPEEESENEEFTVI